jgi:hypothetical protein
LMARTRMLTMRKHAIAEMNNSETAAIGGDNCGVVSIGGLCKLTAGTYLGSGAWDPGR